MMMMYDVYVCVCLHVTIRLLIKSWNDSGLFCLFDDHQNGRLVDNWIIDDVRQTATPHIDYLLLLQRVSCVRISSV